MMKHYTILAWVCAVLGQGFAWADEPEPPLHIDQVVTPWGTPVSRMSYYLEDGAKVQHGPDELFSSDGDIEIRNRYVHGEPDGLQDYFYEGIGKKQREMRYSAGVEVGLWRTWTPEGELLFEGTWKDGQEWEGWFEQGVSGGEGLYHKHQERWKITQWKEGKEVPGSKKEVGCAWRTRSPGTLPDHGMFIRWRWSQFMKRGDYPYLDEMPPYAKVPFLIDYCGRKEEHYQVASDQLVALTRVQFGNPWLQKDGERRGAAELWRAWWRDVGRHRPEERRVQGVRDAEAWELVRGGRDLPVPEGPMVIPPTYELNVHFSSGDYGGVTTEALTIRRTKEGAELVRKFSTQSDGPDTEERWLPFGVVEADRVLRAIGYLTDQPWLLNDEQEIEKRYWGAEKEDSDREPGGGFGGLKLKGRESYGEPYYPNVYFELRDEEERLWWNANVDDWYGGNPDRFNQTHEPVPGTAFPFLAGRYPESVRRAKGKERGWGAN